MTSNKALAHAPVPRRRTSSLAAALAVGLAIGSTALGASAQPHTPTAQELETARNLYKEGKELRAKGDLPGAIEKLLAAHALGNTPVTGIELARTYALAGKLVEAREIALSVARLQVASDETEKSAEARTDAARLAAELRPRIPTLRVRVQGVASGEEGHLVIDAFEVPDAAIGEPLKVNPGHHAVVLRAGEGGTARESRGEVETAEGTSAEITLSVPPPPVTPPPPEPPPAPVAHRNTLVVTLGFGAAIVGGAAGLFTGAAAISKKNQLSSECNGFQCGPENGGSSDLSTARTYATASTVAFGVAGAGLVVGLIGLLTSGSSAAPAPATPHPAGTSDYDARIAPWFGVGAAGVHGTF
jgi:hypothetical protein